LIQAPEVARGVAPKSGVVFLKEPGWRRVTQRPGLYQIQPKSKPTVFVSGNGIQKAWPM